MSHKCAYVTRTQKDFGPKRKIDLLIGSIDTKTTEEDK